MCSYMHETGITTYIVCECKSSILATPSIQDYRGKLSECCDQSWWRVGEKIFGVKACIGKNPLVCMQHNENIMHWSKRHASELLRIINTQSILIFWYNSKNDIALTTTIYSIIYYGVTSIFSLWYTILRNQHWEGITKNDSIQTVGNRRPLNVDSQGPKRKYNRIM
jgi:hypothetical protein